MIPEHLKRVEVDHDLKREVVDETSAIYDAINKMIHDLDTHLLNENPVFETENGNRFLISGLEEDWGVERVGKDWDTPIFHVMLGTIEVYNFDLCRDFFKLSKKF